MSKRSIKQMEDTLAILKKYENHTPPVPELGYFYATLNDSIVYVYEGEPNYEAQAIVLRGGCARTPVGSTYYISEDGCHSDSDIGAHLVMTLREKLDINLPEF